MANHKGKRGSPWSDAEVAQLRTLIPNLERRTMSQEDIAKQIGRSQSSIEGKIRMLRSTDALGAAPGPGLSRYDTPAPMQTDDRLHLEALHQANGYGFSWLPDSLAERFYSLEVAPPKPRMFGGSI